MRRYPDLLRRGRGGQRTAQRPPAGPPTLSVAYDADDAARLATLADYLTRLGLESARLTSREARQVEPLLAPGSPRWPAGAR